MACGELCAAPRARVKGPPIGPVERFGYHRLAVTAGHDTTKNARGGSMHPSIENPNELAKLRPGDLDRR